MAQTKQASDKNVFQWRESPFVSNEGPTKGSDAVGEANPGTDSDQRIKKPAFKTED